MNSAEVAGVLELVASERPDLIGPLVKALERSPTGHGIAELAKLWGIAPEDCTAELAETALITTKHLDRLERKRGVGWRHPRQLVDAPNVPALHSFALCRRGRVTGPRSRRLEVIGLKLERAADSDRRRQMVETFLREPAPPVDGRWLRDFLGARSG